MMCLFVLFFFSLRASTFLVFVLFVALFVWFFIFPSCVVVFVLLSFGYVCFLYLLSSITTPTNKNERPVSFPCMFFVCLALYVAISLYLFTTDRFSLCFSSFVCSIYGVSVLFFFVNPLPCCFVCNVCLCISILFCCVFCFCVFSPFFCVLGCPTTTTAAPRATYLP